MEGLSDEQALKLTSVQSWESVIHLSLEPRACLRKLVQSCKSPASFLPVWQKNEKRLMLPSSLEVSKLLMGVLTGLELGCQLYKAYLLSLCWRKLKGGKNP